MKPIRILTTLLMFAFTATGAQSAPDMSKPKIEFNDFLNSIENLDFPQSDYFAETTVKTQHCLHHTASGKGVSGDYHHFLKPGKIATNIIVGHDKVYRLFSSKNWGYHLGIPELQFAKMKIKYQRLDKICIGTEIDSWGPLKLINGEFVTYVNDWGKGDKRDKKGNRLKVTVPEKDVVHYANKFRGYQYYERYTPFQLDSVAMLCQYYKEYHGIPINYSDSIWDVNANALKGVPGTYTHASYRPDKSDCHPQPELIAMLKSLS